MKSTTNWNLHSPQDGEVKTGNILIAVRGTPDRIPGIRGIIPI